MVEPAAVEPPSLRSQRFQHGSPLAVAPSEGSDEDFQPPHPLRSASVVLSPVALTVVLWATDLLPESVALGFGVSFALLAVIQGGLGGYDLHRSRRLCDALVRAYPDRPPISGLAAWRSAELTAARSRRELTGLVRQLRHETEACEPGAPRSDAALFDEIAALMGRLERRLETRFEPVSPLGMLDLRTLVTGEVSPLYFPERAAGLPAALARALAALEPA